MESLEKILSDCQSLLDRRGSRIKREARQAATRPDSDSPSMRFEVLVFDTKPKSDLTDTRQPFDRDSQYQSEKKLTILGHQHCQNQSQAQSTASTQHG